MFISFHFILKLLFSIRFQQTGYRFSVSSFFIKSKIRRCRANRHTTNARPLFVLWLSNQLKTDIEYWCDERVHQPNYEFKQRSKKKKKKTHWTCKQTHSVCSAQNRIENRKTHYGTKKNKPFLIICHNILFCLVEWSRRISGIKYKRVCVRMIQQ